MEKLKSSRLGRAQGWEILPHAHLNEKLNPSTSAKPVMTKRQNLFVALLNMDTFKMTFRVICVTTLSAHFCVCRHAECLQMYAVSAPFELVLNFP